MSANWWDNRRMRDPMETLRMIEDIATTLGSQNKLTHKGAIYHVKVEPDKDIWQVTCLGTECIDLPHGGIYRGSETLPTELMSKLSVLNMLEPQQPEIEGVGLRSGEDSFWVYA
jgi:hypothetical protein